MSSKAMPSKGGDNMQFSTSHAADLWGRAKTDPKWRLDGGVFLVKDKGNKLKLVDGKWRSASA